MITLHISKAPNDNGYEVSISSSGPNADIVFATKEDLQDVITVDKIDIEIRD